MRVGAESFKTPIQQLIEKTPTEAAQDGKMDPVLELCITNPRRNPTVLKTRENSTVLMDGLELPEALFVCHEMRKHPY